jgi:hypothetical protein
MKKKVGVKARKHWVNPKMRKTSLSNKKVFFACGKGDGVCCVTEMESTAS